MSMSIGEKLQGNLAVLLGGESAEREVSLQSGASVMQALRSMDIPAIAIDCKTENLSAELSRHAINYCFIALHGGDGENGTVQSLLKERGIPYTGSDALSSAIAMDKQQTKRIWQRSVIPTAPFCMIDQFTVWEEVKGKLGSKVMVKPSNEGSSLGMMIVENANQFEKALVNAREYDQEVMAEKWIEGDEYTVGILNGRPLPMIRMETGNLFYDYEAKYVSNETEFYCPSGLDQEEESKLQALSLKAFDILGCSGWGRVDLMLNEEGQPFLLEVNTLPGMTSHSLVPLAAKNAGFSFEALVSAIMEGAF